MVERSKKEIEDLEKINKVNKIKRDFYSIISSEKTKEYDQKIFDIEKKIILKKLEDAK